MKRIVFLLPFEGRVPVGGFKVIYEYANRLAENGSELHLVYPVFNFVFREGVVHRFLRQCKGLFRYLFLKISGSYRCGAWFSLNGKVREHLVWSLDEKYVPRGDIYIATALKTSFYLAKYSRIPSARKYYLIQGYENWGDATHEEVIASYHFPLNKIVIAEWLEKVVHECGEDCTLIHNGFDFDYFSRSVACGNKDKFCVTMLYHTSVGKGCQDGFEALDIVKGRYPQLKVNLFGVSPRPENLPQWYRYYQQPDRQTHNRIYNEAAVFLAPSHSEGFSLTPPEAMQCGCAVVCTDIGGYTVVCKDNRTALVCPVRRPDLLAEKIIYLIENDDERCRIAENGYGYIREFTWERAYAKFIGILNIDK